MSYSSTVLADSPVVYLNLDEASGTSFADSSGNSNTGTGTSTTAGSTSLLTDGSGKAVTFDGSSSRIDLPSIAFTADWTFEAWINLTGSGNTNYKTLINIGGAGDHKIYLLIDASDHLYRWSASDSGFVITRSAIHHIVYTYNNTTFDEKFYVDGTLQHTTSNGGAFTTQTGTPSLGRSGTDHYFQGVMDEVAIYTSVLNSTQVSDHYTAGSTLVADPIAGTETPTVAVTDTSSVTILTVKSATDTPTASLTESSSAAIVGLAIGTSDNPAISHTGTAVVTAATPVAGTDTPTLSVTDSGALAGTVPVTASDTLTVSIASSRSGGTEPIATRQASAYIG